MAGLLPKERRKLRMTETAHFPTDLRRRFSDQRMALLRIAVILVVLAASASAVYWASTGRVMTLLGAFVGLLVLPFLIKRPEYGLLAIVGSNLIIPFSIGTGTGTDLPASVMILALMLGLWVISPKPTSHVFLAFRGPGLPIVGLILVSLLAFGIGQLAWYPTLPKASMLAQLGGAAIIVLSGGAFLLMAFQTPTEIWLRRLTWTFLALSSLYLIVKLIPPLAPSSRVVLSNAATGSVMWAWLACMAFAQAAFNHKLNPLVRIGLGLVVLAVFDVHMLQGRSWASGWIPALVGVAAALWIARPRLGWVLALGIGVIALTQLQDLIDLIVIGDNEYSLFTRLEAWRIVAEIVKVNPLLGLGPANYYAYTSYFPILGFSVNFSSHNNYVDLFAQAGLIGLAMFAWFVVAIGTLGWRLRLRVPDGFARAYVYGALGGLVATLASGMLGDWFLPFVYNIGMNGMRASMFAWLFLGGLVALDRFYPASTAGRDEGADALPGDARG
jgi:hypothetical protein